MLGRRQFLIASSYLAAAPALLATLFRTDGAQAAIDARAGDNGNAVTAPPPDTPLMQIQGWECPGESEDRADDQMWVRMNSSWRGDWR